jgi:hypothetical protein
LPGHASSPRGGNRRSIGHALAVLVMAALAWLVFLAYRQPDFILDFAGMRLC